MQELVTNSTITSLELVKQINIFRKEEDKERAELEHKSLLEVIRDEFEDEIGRLEILPSEYKSERGKMYPMFVLTLAQAKQVLDRIKFRSRVRRGLQEETALKTIEQLLGVSLIRQFKVGKYRIDGYDSENNVAYEIDEPHHKSQSEQDTLRQEKIERIIKCTFKRIKL